MTMSYQVSGIFLTIFLYDFGRIESQIYSGGKIIKFLKKLKKPFRFQHSIKACQLPASESGPNEPTLPGIHGTFFLGLNHSQIYAHMRAKFGHDRSGRLTK